jgi:hypothetical protein
LLVQRTTAVEFGHCEFGPEAITQGFCNFEKCVDFGVTSAQMPMP